MNGHSTEPPDKHKSKAIMLENDLISICGMDIKAEPIDKQEQECFDDDIVTVSRSTNTANGVTLDNLISDTAMNGTEDFSNFGDMTEVKVENVKEEANQNACKGSYKGKTSQNNDGRFSKRNNQNSSGSNGVAKKNALQARKQPNAKSNGDKKKTLAMKVNRKKHKCSLCNYVTSQKCHLNVHMLKHTGEKPHLCTICSKRFTKKQSLQSHMKKHVDEFLFSCSICLQGFHHTNEKMEHEAGCTIRRYECHVCKEFSSLLKTNLKDHLRVHTGDKPFECDHCSMKFNIASNLKQHRKTHINPRPLKFKCSVCFKSFKQQTEMENHEANCKRSGYKCDVCKSYTTRYQSELMRHMQIHTGEKPFRCEICLKCFASKSNFIKHKKFTNDFRDQELNLFN